MYPPTLSPSIFSSSGTTLISQQWKGQNDRSQNAVVRQAQTQTETKLSCFRQFLYCLFANEVNYFNLKLGEGFILYHYYLCSKNCFWRAQWILRKTIYIQFRAKSVGPLNVNIFDGLLLTAIIE